jgi:nucleoside-diphosphate-sugar epimerase
MLTALARSGIMLPDASSRCAITGTTGYIGAYLRHYLQDRGMQITELRRIAPGEALSEHVVPFTLGQAIAPGALDGADILIHCAYDFTVNSWEDIKRVNVDGTLQLFETAATAGVKNILFISTISSFAGCCSLYGKAKFLVEQAGKRLGVRSIRPGLVFDHAAPRGMVGALNGLMKRTAIIPLVGDGEQILYPCHIDDLARMIYVLCTSSDLPDLPHVITAASQPGITFREILLRLASARGRQIHFFPVPYSLALFGLQTLERAGVKSRLRSDSLISLLNQNTQVDFSGLSMLEMQGCFFRQILVEDEPGKHYDA